MIITSLQPQVKNVNRISVYIDGEFSFGLFVDLAISLKKGQILSQEQAADLVRQDVSLRLRASAFNYISFRPRSKKEVSNYLRFRISKYEEHYQRWLGKEDLFNAIERTVDYLEERGYLNDQEFAKQWASFRAQSRQPKSDYTIKQELRIKGVRDEDIAQALLDLGKTNQQRAVTLAQKVWPKYKKLSPVQAKKKLFDFLRRRGFGWDEIKEAYENFDG